MTPTFYWARSLLLAAVCGLGCASYKGSARDVTPLAVEADAGWTRVDRVTLVRQKGIKDCGSAALSTVLRYYEPDGPAALEREAIDRALRQAPGQGLAAVELRDYARQHGFTSYVIVGSFNDLTHELAEGRPVIVGVHKPLSSGEALAHYEVFIGYHPEKRQVLTLDPAHGLRQNDLKGFLTEWTGAGFVTIIVMPEEAAPSGATASGK